MQTPVKWMAPESLQKDTIVPKWCLVLCVLVWAVTRGDTPYPGIDLGTYWNIWKMTTVWKDPILSWVKFYKIMSRWLVNDSENRPTFTQILQGLKGILVQNKPGTNPNQLHVSEHVSNHTEYDYDGYLKPNNILNN